MYFLPNETKALSPFDTKEIIEQVERAFTVQSGQDTVRPLMEGGGARDGIWQLTPKNTTISLFTLPYRFSPVVKNNDRVNLVYDIRPFTRLDNLGQVIVNNPIEYKFHTTVALLTRLWVDDEFHTVANNVQEYLIKAYTRWIGVAINQKLLINETTQPNVLIITAYYVYCQLHPKDSNIDSSKFSRVAAIIARAAMTNVTTTEEILEQLPRLETIDDYIKALQDHAGTDRFAKLTPGFIFTLVQFAWYGSSVAVICSVAIEYPPVFVAMVYNALNNGGYQKTPVGRILREMNLQDGQHFTKIIDTLIFK